MPTYWFRSARNTTLRPITFAILRKTLPREFPGTTFYFLPADMTTQVLNFGLPAPVDVQIEGQDLQANREVADTVLSQLRHVPGLTDLRIQQEFDYPRFNVAVDRTKAAQGGYTDSDITSSLLTALSGSFQVAPTFFLNWQNGVQYEMISQNQQYRIQSLQDVGNIPISSPTMIRPEILSEVASINRGSEMEVLSHYNIRRVVDIYGSVQDRDLGAVGRDVTRIVNQNQKLLPRGSFFRIRGQLDTMRTSYEGLLAGLGFAIVLVYFLIVVNFQSWLDPFIIITALPAALAGIIVFLFLTHTTLSVPALMGAIMCMGVATANSILVVAFATERLASHGDPLTGRHRSRLHAFSASSDDRSRHDHRHDPDGPRFGRWRRGERPARPRGCGRLALRHGGHARLCSHGVCIAAWKASGNPRSPETENPNARN